MSASTPGCPYCQIADERLSIVQHRFCDGDYIVDLRCETCGTHWMAGITTATTNDLMASPRVEWRFIDLRPRWLTSASALAR